ncbi:MAG: HYR domain-containing protein, partial [Gemmatimonadota bacterium]|nr:HYR domain-containing protein [Gemmatimonadota bacterium]
NNVPEYGAVGRLTVQLVLEEETSNITIHTPSLSTSRSDHIVMQGIENSIGTVANFVPGRVRSFLKLTNDAVRFSPVPNLRPVLSIPADISLDLAIGSCSPVSVDVGSASASDDTEGLGAVYSVRSDLLELDAPYPAGVTTIEWSVIDAGGLKAVANQKISINDKQNPSIVAPASLSVGNDAGLGSAVVDAGSAVAEDNCANPSVEGVRSDAAALSAPFMVGVTKITWTALDAAGNSAVAEQLITVRDVEAPVVGSLSNILVDATNTFGAVVNFSATASDNVLVTSISCSRESGSVFPAGDTHVVCTARDAAGNEGSGSFVVHVRGAAEQLAEMIEFVGDLGLSNGVGNPMLNHLQNALKSVDSPDQACKKIEDFIKALSSSKTRAEVSPSELYELLASAKQIQAVLGCV